MTTDLAPPTATEALTDARHMLEETGDLLPTIMLGTTPPTIMLSPEHPNAMFMVIREMIRKGEMVRPDWISLVMDAYHFMGEPNEPHPGSLAPLFAAGDPRVGEALVALCVAPDGPSYVKCWPYVRLPDGSLEWEELRDMDRSIGDLPRQMQQVVRP